MPTLFFHEELLVTILQKTKVQIYYMLYSSKALIFRVDLLFF